jgi:hypothetical protein
MLQRYPDAYTKPKLYEGIRSRMLAMGFQMKHIKKKLQVILFGKTSIKPYMIIITNLQTKYKSCLNLLYRMFVGVIIWFFSLVSVFTKLKM